MARTHRLSTIGTLIVCLVVTPWGGILFASEERSPSSAAPSSQATVNSTSEAQGRHSASPADVDSASEQSGSATEVLQPTVEPPRFTLDAENLAANAPLGPASPRAWRSTFTFAPSASSSLTQRGGHRGRGRGGHNGAVAAIVIGAVASIAGGAILVYANRPECSATNHTASGCGYGTKVVGGAVLSAGMVGILVGALTWR
jgi:hypothetical protein